MPAGFSSPATLGLLGSIGGAGAGGFSSPLTIGLLGRIGGYDAGAPTGPGLLYYAAAWEAEMNFLRQSTASQEVLLGPFVDDSDFKTPETELSIANTDIKLWKHGATSEVNKNSGGATHIAAGRYYAVLDATDTNTVGMLELNVAVAGALPSKAKFAVLEEAVYDSLFAASASGYQVPIWSSAGASVNLSGTTISTSQAIASVSGAVGSVTGAVGSVTATVDANLVEVAGSPVEAADIPTAAENAEQVWSSGSRTLTADGLNAIDAADPGGVASTFPQMVVQLWRRFFKKTVKTTSGNTIRTYADNGTTVRTTQAFTDDGVGNETLEAAS